MKTVTLSLLLCITLQANETLRQEALKHGIEPVS